MSKPPAAPWAGCGAKMPAQSGAPRRWGDLEKLFGRWDQWGWHPVTFYGDLKEPVYALADAAGWKVIEEA